MDSPSPTASSLPSLAPVAPMSAAAAVPVYEPAPMWLRILVGVCAAVGGVLGLAMMGLAAAHAPKALGAVVMLQLLTPAAAVMGLIWARGGFRTGPAIAALCVSGAFALPAVLSVVSHREALGPLSMKVWAAAELGCGGLIGLAGLAAAIERDRALRGPAVRGTLLALPALVLGALFVVGGRLGIDAAMAKLPTGLRLGVMGMTAVAAGILLCMGAHALSRAFAGAVTAGRAKS